MKHGKPVRIVNNVTGTRIGVPRMSPSVLAFFREKGRVGGALGGLSRSPSKVRASRRNGRRGGRPRKQKQAQPKSEVLSSIQGSKDNPLHLPH